MNIFPRIQYLFQTLPISIPQKFFQELNKYVRKFLWKDKMSRVSMERLTWKYELGGLQLPNFKNYYRAAQMRFLASFFEETKVAWVNIELNKIGEKIAEDFIYKWEPKLITAAKDTPLLKHLLNIWNKIKDEIGIKGSISPKTPLNQNPFIAFSKDNQFLNIWHRNGIVNLEDCYERGQLMSFLQLRNKYAIPQNTFFCYFQLKAYLRDKLGPTMSLPRCNEVELLIRRGIVKKFTSKIYELLQAGAPKQGLNRSRQRWETDLNITIDQQLWENLCKDSMTNTINVRYRLVQYNFLHQLYLTPQKLHKIKPELSDQCFRCGEDVGSFIHSTWSCPKVKTFWLDIRNFLEQVTGIVFPQTPDLALLGNIEGARPKLKLSNYQLVFVKLALAVARKCIAVTWKSDTSLDMQRWHAEIQSCIPLEKITYNLRNKYSTFLQIWRPYTQIMRLNL